MTPINLPYIKKYADRHGKVRTYYRRDGRSVPVSGDTGSAGWLESYQKIHASFETAPVYKGKVPGTFGYLVMQYYNSPDFKQLANGSRSIYSRYINDLDNKVGKFRVEAITRKALIKWRDGMQDRPQTANKAVQVVQSLFAFAADREIVAENPAEKIKNLKVITEGWKAWPEGTIERFKAESQGSSRMAFYLALYTGQRLGDIIAMRWDAISDNGIAVTQQKTGAKLWIPLTPTLVSELSAISRKGISIIQRKDGQPYTVDGFKTIWQREQKRLNVSGSPFHGLRKNATSALFEAGCTPQEVQSITGHKTLGMVQHYGRDADQRRMATTAIARLNDRQPPQKG